MRLRRESARSWSSGGALTAVVVVGIGYGTLQNLTLLVALSRVASHDYGRASAIWNVGFDAGTGLGAVVFGFVATSGGFSMGFLVLGGLGLFHLSDNLSTFWRMGKRGL